MKEQYLLTAIPEPLLARLIKEAETRDTSIANIVSGVLAHEFRVFFTPSDRHLRPELKDEVYVRPSGQSIGITKNLRIPWEVLEEVRALAKHRGVSMRSIILSALSQAFDLDDPGLDLVIGKRPGRPRTKHGRPIGRQKASK